MVMLMVNGEAVPAPSSLKLTLVDVGSGISRSAAGTAVMDRTGVKRRLQLRWAHMSASALADLLGKTCAQTFFQAKYPDPAAGGAREMDCCCTERAVGMLRMDGGMPVWTDVEMEWIER